MRRIALLAALAAALSLGAPAQATEEWYQNDGFESGDTVGCQAGFVVGEICASVFVPDLGDYPCRLTRIWVLVCDDGGGGASADFTLSIWADDGSLQPGSLLATDTINLTATPGWNEIDLLPYSILVNSGGIRVGLGFTQLPYPSFARDFDGSIQFHRNLIMAVPGGWNWSETFGLQGDWILRLEADTNYGVVTPTPTPTGDIPTVTPTPEATPTGGPMEGTIAWDEASYTGLDAHARLTVVDADLNLGSSTQEQVDVRVWSQSDPYPGGISITLYETTPDSDTFRSVYPDVSFSQTASDDGEDRIHVTEGDTVYARYLDADPSGERLATSTWNLEEGMVIALSMPAHLFGGGDICSLDLDYTNSGATQDVDLYVLFDVFGYYFCYPTWQSIDLGLTHEDLFVPGDYSGEISLIPTFEMPAVGAAGPLYFYAAMFEDGQLGGDHLAANVAVWDFSLE